MNRLAFIALALITVPTFSIATQTTALNKEIERQGRIVVNVVSNLLNPVSDEEKFIGTVVAISGAFLLSQKCYIMGPLTIGAGYIIGTGKTQRTLDSLQEKTEKLIEKLVKELR